MKGFVITVLLITLPLSARGADAQDAVRCFDVAVVARLVQETPEPVPDPGPDSIIIRWPWVLDFKTEEVVIGREDRQRLIITTSKHTNFNSQIEYFLLLLRNDPDRGYVAADIIIDVIRDRRGRFVIPFDRPAEDYSLRPKGWLPATYESYLRPISYRSRDAWWLAEPYINEKYVAEIPPGWHRRSGEQIVALRGLYLSDLQAMMADEPGAICGH